MSEPRPDFLTENIDKCARYLPGGEDATHNRAIQDLVQAIRDTSGNVHSLREYANDLEDRVAQLEAQS